MKYRITIKETIFIRRSPEAVWDLTQDYGKRPLWDKSIKGTTELQAEPRRVHIRGRILCAELVYRHNERPEKTSLAMVNIRSPFIIGGGGSWKYEAVDGGTEWTQTNTLALRPSVFNFLLRPLIRSFFKANTRNAMKKAKQMLEQAQ